MDFFASDEQRHDHVGKYNDVAQRQNGIALDRARDDRLALWICHIASSLETHGSADAGNGTRESLEATIETQRALRV